MKSIPFILAFLILSIAPGDSVAGTPGRSIRFTEIPLPHNPLIAFRVMVHSGSVNDPAGKEGLNALTAMAIAYGGTARFSYGEIQQTLYPWAASINVQFDKEITVITGNVHRDHIMDFYDIFSGLLLNPRFDEADITRNKTLLLNYLRNTLRGTNDEELGKWGMQIRMYEGHPYGHADAGAVQGLESITPDDMRAFYRQYYTRDNIRFGIAGGYDRNLIEKIDSDLANLPAGKPDAAVLPGPKPIRDLELLIIEKPNRSTAISFGFPIGVTRADKDFYALMVANSYFGEHRTFNGVLMNELRGLRGLNYGTYSYVENFIQDGGSTLMVPNVPRRQQYFSVWIRPVEHTNRHFALRLALYELDKLVRDGLSPEDFVATRDYLVSYSKLWTQTLSRRLGYMMDSEWYGTPYFIDAIEEELGTLTVEDVNRAIKRHLQSKHIVIAAVTDDGEAFRDALLSNAPSPIIYANPNVEASILAKDAAVQELMLNFNPDRIRIIPAGEMFE